VLEIRPSQPEAWADAIERGLDDTAWRGKVASQAPTWASLWSHADMLDDLECAVRALRWRDRADRPGNVAALLADRDDTLVHDVPYNGSPDHVVLQGAAGRGLRWLRDAGIPVIVVSNQSGVARGLHTETDVRAVNDRINALLHAEGAHVEAFYFCPHHPDFGAPCACRKPEPGMLQQAAVEHGLDLSRSWMVGDSPRDLEAGTRAGAFVAGFGTVSHASVPTYQRWPELVRDYMRWLEGAGPRNDGASQGATKNSRNSRGSASVVARG
jgi:histidinol-phosphate phosphatase family protein